MIQFCRALGLFFLVLLALPVEASDGEIDKGPANPNDLLLTRPWSLMFYYGRTSELIFAKTVAFKFEDAEEDVYSLELAYTLPPENVISRFFSHIGSRFFLAGNLVRRVDHKRDKNINEVDAYIGLRWQNLPWNRYVATSFAIADGLSYASDPPRVEFEDDPDSNSNLLNYLMLEATFALPTHPQWQLVYRIHHRSGVYGLFDTDSGSNTVGLGLRYFFD